MDEDALRAFIADLNEDEQASLIALAWLGRGDIRRRGWDRRAAWPKSGTRATTAEYLLGMEMLGDLLEEGLSRTRPLPGGCGRVVTPRIAWLLLRWR